jgi:predicted enzyme related to lactoylglutathione lyase
VIVQVSDLARGVDFYRELLGDAGVPVPGRGHYFDCGVILAVIGAGARAKPQPDHLYFSHPDVDALHARATKLGCLDPGEVHGAPAGEVEVRPWGERSFYAIDPFGNHLCFVAAASEFTAGSAERREPPATRS